MHVSLINCFCELSEHQHTVEEFSGSSILHTGILPAAITTGNCWSHEYHYYILNKESGGKRTDNHLQNFVVHENSLRQKYVTSVTLERKLHLYWDENLGRIIMCAKKCCYLEVSCEIFSTILNIWMPIQAYLLLLLVAHIFCSNSLHFNTYFLKVTLSCHVLVREEFGSVQRRADEKWVQYRTQQVIDSLVTIQLVTAIC
jgi:hypothetical protein